MKQLRKPTSTGQHKIQSRILLCLGLVLVAITPSFRDATSQAYDVASRESDERVATLEERQRLASSLLSEAEQLRNAGDLVKAAAALNRAGRLQIRLHRPEEALGTFRLALSTAEKSADPAATIDSLNGTAAVFAQLSKCEPAQNSLQKSMAISDRSGYVAGRAEALLIRSDCENHTNHALALRTAQESLALWQSIHDKWGIAKAYATIGHYQLTLNDLAESVRSHNAAFDLWRDLNIPAEQGEALINLGFIEYRRGAWQSSLALLTQAQSLIDENAEPYRMGQIAGGIAEAFIESGLPEIGLQKSLLAAKYFRAAESPRAVLVTSWDIGRAHLLLGNHADAIASLDEGVKGGAELDEAVLVGLCNEYLGRTYSAMEQLPTALRHYQAALEQYRKVSNPMEEARTVALIGQVYERQGKTEKARKEYQTALLTFRRLSDHLNESATLYAAGNLEMNANNLDLAERYLRESIDATENIRRVSTSNDLASAFSATVHERYESLIDCFMRKHEADPNQQFAEEAFRISELSRARSLSELLRATQTTFVPGLDPKLSEEERALRQSLRVKEDEKVTLLGRTYSAAELASLESEIQRLENLYTQVTEKIRAQYPSFEQMDRPTAWDLRQIQERVVTEDQTVLLEYSLGAKQSHVWAVTSHSFKSYELPGKNEINQAAQEVYALLAGAANRDESQLAQASERLSGLILSPIISELSRSRIIVVADGTLHYIPFQLLPNPANDNQPLVATHEVINAPSATILGGLRQEAAKRQPVKSLVAFGDPVFQPSDATKGTDVNGDVAGSNPDHHWQQVLRDIELNGDSFDPSVIKPLFYAKRELANLRELFADDAFIAGDFDATRERLTKMDLTQYEILHFATHGFLDPRRPENSGLVLSTITRDGKNQNGFVSLQDVYQLRAPVELVVLSACQTGLGKEVRGEGLIGLTRGFMYAGASSVVASLWKVDDEVTAELMKRFYKNMLDDGLAPAAALRAAQNSIRSQPQWRSPHYWAAFTIQGEYQRPITRLHRTWNRTYLLLGAGSLVVLLTVSLLMVLRRRKFSA